MVHMSSSWCHGNPPGPQLWPLSLAPEQMTCPDDLIGQLAADLKASGWYQEHSAALLWAGMSY